MEAFPWIVIAFLAATALQLVIYWGIYARFAFGRHTPESEERPPVSVIVAARNEHDNLLAYLPLIFQQQYPDFEVVVVDDRSYDGTGEVLKAFSLKYPNCKVVTVREPEDRPGRTTHFNGGKKYALTLGIKA
ncbi:MAG: glycosyltransferase, partial [Bacteroidota bacterium]